MHSIPREDQKVLLTGIKNALKTTSYYKKSDFINGQWANVETKRLQAGELDD